MDLGKNRLGKWKHFKDLPEGQSLVCKNLTPNHEFYVIISYWAQKFFFSLENTLKVLPTFIYKLRRLIVYKEYLSQLKFLGHQIIYV